MNTYNDNLRSIVFDSLQKQELDQKKLNAQLLASKIALYYSQGARINAQEKLEAARIDLGVKTSVQTQSVKNASLSTNLLASANQEKTYMDLSVTNTAICASNVQIAANAVLKLASDIGSINSILSAADYSQDIQKGAEDVKLLMDETAYAAELASFNAMETSEYVSGVSYKSVASHAKVTDESVKGFLEIADSEFAKISAVVEADNATVAKDGNQEKVCEGKLEDDNVDYNAAVSAYNSLNNELNLGLKVAKPIIPSPNLTVFSPDSFSVKFNSILSPFQKSTDDLSNYPVVSYFAILVKNSERSTFNLANADHLFENQVIGTTPYSCFPIPIPQDSKGQSSISFDIEIPFFNIVDSEGDTFNFGQDYVVFIYAQYNDTYKRKINDFDNFLTAPSEKFVATHQLAGPAAITVTTTGDSSVEKQPKGPKEKNSKLTVVGATNTDPNGLSTVLNFSMPVNANYPFKVEYRCMFLPVSASLTKGLLTQKSLESIEKKTNNLEAIYSKFNGILTVAQKAITDVELKVSKKASLESQIKALKPTENTVLSSSDAKKLTKLNQENDSLVISDLNAAKSSALQNIEDLLVEQQKEIDQLSVPDLDVVDFFFDIDLASLVSTANYSIPKQSASAATDKKTSWTLVLDANTTDNFGSPLIKGDEYLPVVLTVSMAKEIDLPNFSPVLSSYSDNEKFKFQIISPTPLKK